MLLRDGLLHCRLDADQRLALVEISRSRTEPANRVSGPDYSGLSRRASAYAVACAIRVSQHTVTRCLERAAELRSIGSAGRHHAARTAQGREDYGGGQNLACRAGCAKPTQFGYPHEAVNTRLLAAHSRDHDRALAIQAWQT